MGLFVFILPLIKIVWISFTDYNLIGSPVFNYGANFVNILHDDLFVSSLFNMVLFTFVSTILGCLVAFVLYRASVEWPKSIRILIGLLFTAVTITCLIPFSLKYFLSGDSYGYINSILMSVHIVEQPVQFLFDPIMAKIISIMLTIFTMIGPLYMYLLSSKGSFRAKLIISAIIGIVINVTTCFTQIIAFGFPSVNYNVHNPIVHIFDYGLIRLDIGMMCAMIIITLVLLAFSSTILCGIAYIISFIKLNEKPLLVTKIAGIIFSLFSLGITMIIFIQRVMSIFKPMAERFIFPPRLLALHPTFENIAQFFESGIFIKIILAMVAQTLIGIIIYSIAIIPAGYALSKVKKYTTPIIICLVVAVIIPFCAFQVFGIKTYLQLAFFLVLTSPCIIGALFIIAKAIQNKKLITGFLAGAAISILGSFTNLFVNSYNTVPTLFSFILTNNQGDYVTPFLITSLILFIALIAALLTGISLFDPAKKE